MATLVTFTSITPQGELQNLATNVSTEAFAVLRIKPLAGDGENGGTKEEAARPVVEPLTDADGLVLPQYARLYRTDQGGYEIAGTDVPLKVALRSSAFVNGSPTQEVYFDLVFDPQQELDGLTSYAFEFATLLPALWQSKRSLTYVAPVIELA